MLIEEISEREAAWDRTSRRCPAPNVDPSGWGTFQVRIRVGGGRRWWVGSFRTLSEAKAAAAWAREMRRRRDAGQPTREVAAMLEPIVTRVEVPAEPVPFWR